VPSRNNIVRITGDRLDGKPQSTPRPQILSRDSVQGVAHYDGPVWLDRLAHTADPSMQRIRGFGAELDQAVAQRRQWLVSKDVARFRVDGGFDLRTSAFARLRAREMQRVGLEAAARLRASFHPVTAAERIQGRVGETIQASGGKIVIIERPTASRAGARAGDDRMEAGQGNRQGNLGGRFGQRSSVRFTCCSLDSERA
jgi:hypothetical protein